MESPGVPSPELEPQGTVVGSVVPAPHARALARRDFPVDRVAQRLGIAPSRAQLTLRDAERSREAIDAASEDFLAADDDRRAGRPTTRAVALDPDFPTGVGSALVGAAVLWEHRPYVPRIALRVAKDHYEDGRDDLAASFIALVLESVEPGEDGEPGRDEASAWAAQSLLVSVLQRSGSPAQADEIARDLAAHNIPLDLWRADDPSLPDDSLAWHGGAFVGGIPPRRDERHLSYEDVHDYLDQLLADMRREDAAENERQ